MYSEHLRACTVQLRPRAGWRVAALRHRCLQVSRIVITNIMLWVNQISDQIMNIISTEFPCAGRCSACVKGKRSVQYCWLIKKHDDKSGLCVNCYKAKLDQSVTQCRQDLGHKGSNALMTEPLVAPNCSEEENAQRCISSGFTPCCAELVRFSAIRVSDAHTATTKGGE